MGGWGGPLNKGFSVGQIRKFRKSLFSRKSIEEAPGLIGNINNLIAIAIVLKASLALYVLKSLDSNLWQNSPIVGTLRS